MLRRLLSDTDAVRALSDKLGIFKDPQQLEQYVVASEVAVEVLDLFFSRVLGPGREPAPELGAVRDCLGACFPSERMEAVHEHVERLEDKVGALERRLDQLQRRLDKSDASYDDEQEANEAEKGRHAGARSQAYGGGHSSESASSDSEQVGSEQVVCLKDAERGRQTGASQLVHGDGDNAELKKLGEFVCNGDNSLEGIIAHLTRECGGNVDEKGVVAITSSEFHDGDEPKTVADLGTGPWFGSLDNPDSWICYDFKEKRVVLASYSIRTHVGPSFPRSWVLEVSNDGAEDSWQVVDRREDTSELNSPYVTHNFACNGSASKERFRFVRLHQTGKNHNGGDELYLTSLEVFGTLYGK